MTKPILRAAAAACFFLAAPALAETAGEPASAALLMQAAQKAKDFAQYRYAYTLDFWTSDGDLSDSCSSARRRSPSRAATLPPPCSAR